MLGLKKNGPQDLNRSYDVTKKTQKSLLDNYARENAKDVSLFGSKVGVFLSCFFVSLTTHYFHVILWKTPARNRATGKDLRDVLNPQILYVDTCSRNHL